ncbi:TOG array regulator of axonemal microtubules protein 1-like [Antedon mediterranea]|uniref:TOG array regulator of axonemal microtubules protein 1-like n=1 Tax=Antedon mediterranea TaxID=105859 RepID=UPI003AF6B47D
MAGTVARPNVHNLGDRDVLREDHRGDHRQMIGDLKSSQSMEENEILHRLEDNNSFHKTEVLNSLRSSIHSNDGQLPFQDCSIFFKRLQTILVDSDWDVRHESIQLISDVIPHLNSELDKCMAYVLPQLISNLGDTKVTVRKSVIQTIHVYMKNTQNVRQILNAVVIYGLESEDPNIRTETTKLLPMLLTPEFAKEDLSSVSHSLARKLSDNNRENSEIVRCTLERVQNLVGEDEFCSYVDKFTPPVRQAYYRKSSRASISSARSDISEIDISNSVPPSADSSKRIRVLVRQSNKFNHDVVILTDALTRQLSDEEWKVRFKGVGELRSVLQDFPDNTRIMQEFQTIVGFICNLLDDTNFKVVQGALDIFQVLVNKLKMDIKPFLKLLINALSKKFGDAMVVVRQTIMQIMMQLMQILSPQPVLVVLFESLQNKKSSIREGVLNITIAALLKFPSNEFDLGELSREIAPTLSDSKRRVRQPSLEVCAVLASAMGPSRIAPLITAVDQVELQMDEDGVMRAVQSRLARRQLPKLRDDGLVEYAPIMPVSATTRATSSCSYDILWIMKAAGGTTQTPTRERTFDHPLELAELSEAPLVRFSSAGKGRDKLLWQDENDNKNPLVNGSQSDRTHANSAPSHQKDDGKHAYRTRHTWGSIDTDAHGLTELAAPGRRRHGSKDKNVNSADRPPDTGGSYRQMHLDMLKRASLSGNTNSFKPPMGYGQSQSAPPTERESNTLDMSNNHKYVPSFAKNDRESERKTKNVASLSSSWPDSAFNDDPIRSKKKEDSRTDPLSTYHPGDFYRNTSPKKSKPTMSPIPLKPALVGKVNRSEGKRNGRLSPLDKSPREDVDDWDQSYGTMKSDDEDLMETSLQRLRASADKRKKKHQAVKSDYIERNGYSSDKSLSPSSDLGESGIYSMTSTFNTYSTTESKSSPKKKGGKKTNTADSPFTGKPVMARGMSAKNGRRTSPDTEPNPFEYKPTSGATFQTKQTANVSVIGRAYGKNDNGYTRSNSPPVPTIANAKKTARERRRQAQTTPLSMASVNHIGGIDLTDDGQPSNHRDIGVVVGKGVFGQGSDSNLDGPVRKISHTSTGSKGSSSNVAYSPSFEDSDEEDIPLHGTFSKSTIEKVKQKNKEMELKRAQKDQEREELERLLKEQEIEERQFQFEEHRKEQIEKQRQREAKQKEREEKLRLEREQRQRERDARKTAMNDEREARKRALEIEGKKKKEARQKAEEERKEKIANQRKKLKEIDSFVIDATPITPRLSPKTNDNSVSPTEFSTPLTITYKPPVSRTKPKMPPELKSPPSTMREEAQEDSSEMKPFNNPDNALRDALSYLANDDWEMKVDGMNYVRRLSAYHSNVLSSQLHTVNIAVLAEVKNLRSQVSLMAIKTFGDLFVSMKSGMDKDLDKICKTLLPKNGEASGFIRDATEKTMQNMVENVTLQKALTSVLQGGSSSRNGNVTKSTALNVGRIVDRMGPGRILSGIKDVTDAVLVAAAKFTLDASQETRYYGRKIFHALIHHEDFDRLLKKHVNAKDLTSLRDILENIRTKGMGDKPSDTPSARAKRGVSNSRLNSSSNSREKVSSASSDVQTTPPSSSVKKGRRSGKVEEQYAESIKMLHKNLSSTEWMVRLKGIQTLQDLCVENPDIITSNIVKVFDAFVLRLQDPNSKVNVQALQTMEEIVPRLAEYLPAVIQRVAPALASNLASKNSSIAKTSSEILDLLMKYMDPPVLVQPFCNATEYGNTRVKPPMIKKLSDLSSMVWPRKQQPVIRFIVPILGHLLSNMSGSGAVHGGTGNIREATNTLAKTLYSLMGDSLFQHSTSLPPRQQKALRDLVNDS